MEQKQQIIGLVLAGGAGTRVANRDKGLLEWHGKPLVQHVIERLQGQVDEIFISCARNKQQYAIFGLPLVQDAREGFQGPLAGIESMIEYCRNAHLVVAPCDTPMLPDDLVPRLMQSLLAVGETGSEHDVSYAWDGSRAHYLCAAFRRGVLPGVVAQLDSGRRSMRSWYAELDTVMVDFSDQPQAFRNLNYLD
jgi:molybdopterin-guanine dinucleotide biosynthesis protein A